MGSPDLSVAPIAEHPGRLAPFEVQGADLLARYTNGHVYTADPVIAAAYGVDETLSVERAAALRELRRRLGVVLSQRLGCPRCWTADEAAISLREALFPSFDAWCRAVLWTHAPATGLDCRACEKTIEGEV